MTGATVKTATFPGSLDALSPIGAFVLDAAAAAGLGPRAAYRLRLAVDEVVTNIIVHGYTEAGRTGMLELSTRLTQDSLSVEVEDTGEPYDVTAHALPTAEELARPLEERVEGGLGLFLITQSVDSFRHERVDPKNRTLLVMRRG
jgi:anti-sigma regulatory factor (Ser/Thr protein kinase)